MALWVTNLFAGQLRRPANEDELRFWLQDMATHHFTVSEMAAVVGLSSGEIPAALDRLVIQPARASNVLMVLPYPGGRHPRIGFLDGAIDPQRETKFSVFAPWDSSSYVVVDLPEAIFSNLGLIYLAHTHVPTMWTAKRITLPPLEWTHRADGSLESERVLPNKIAFGARVKPMKNAVQMELWLHNDTDRTITGLRVQNCVILKAAAGFNQQTNANKVFAPPYVACRSIETNRWIITAWERCDRTWANPPVPCMHSDPRFPDCPPGETQRLRGWLSFYEGMDVGGEFKRITALPDNSFLRQEGKTQRQ